ncbi:hypothetical protein [Amycolatopsis aidingensis]|uniref:hypothetical protein n=1 Tax=Amycolatopsis aidingensis TaxID=2842453 RepID=UPI001C0D8A65|nr:hypothetical protein [Amycolatopsis aidingensis]
MGVVNSATELLVRPSARVGVSDVRRLELLTRTLRVADHRYGGRACRADVLAALSTGRRMLASASTQRVRAELYPAVADQHNLAGWVSFDSGLTATALGHFNSALTLAAAERNYGLLADVRYRMGHVYLHQGTAHEAIRQFGLGQHAAKQDGDPGVTQAVLLVHQARALAQLGDSRQALSMLGRAVAHFSQADTETAPPWAELVDSAEIAAMIGSAHTELARYVDVSFTRSAIVTLSSALTGYGNSRHRSRSLAEISLAINRILAGDLEQGLATALRALELSATLRSTRVRNRFVVLERELGKHLGSVEAQRVAGRIAEFVARQSVPDRQGRGRRK